MLRCSYAVTAQYSAFVYITETHGMSLIISHYKPHVSKLTSSSRVLLIES
jgi:hypothetical protein